LPSAFRDSKAKYRVRVRIGWFGPDICKPASDETGKEIDAEAARDQEVLEATDQLSRDECERPALVGRGGGRHCGGRHGETVAWEGCATIVTGNPVGTLGFPRSLREIL
jgi:hypothetical protein